MSRSATIAEVCDVAKTGQTKKPFGRVFYTKGKSLIFYAYDLDQQPGVKTASSFRRFGEARVRNQGGLSAWEFSLKTASRTNVGS